MGIRSIAVFSEADAGALHVALADEAHPIGPPPARSSYLDISAILAAAAASGAEAVHPGYGFLAENAEFSEACATAGLDFVGPPEAAIRAMGSKSAAKAIMEGAGVPVLPGYHGKAEDEATLQEAAKKAGYPILIKPSAGGGGKGMRVVERPEDLSEAIAAAKREAASAFGDEHLLIEKFLPRTRHVEVQLFADMHGNVVHLFERDCSVQRHYQKVIEEAPAPGLAPGLATAMAEAAMNAARAIGYVGAGTVEFLVDGESFYFMEMNTRLQVEHPVTEMITGCDLVEWQIKIAAGEQLPATQDGLAASGHAFEARLYAEDPADNFRPLDRRPGPFATARRGRPYAHRFGCPRGRCGVGSLRSTDRQSGCMGSRPRHRAGPALGGLGRGRGGRDRDQRGLPGCGRRPSRNPVRRGRYRLSRTPHGGAHSPIGAGLG